MVKEQSVSWLGLSSAFRSDLEHIYTHIHQGIRKDYRIEDGFQVDRLARCTGKTVLASVGRSGWGLG